MKNKIAIAYKNNSNYNPYDDFVIAYELETGLQIIKLFNERVDIVKDMVSKKYNFTTKDKNYIEGKPITFGGRNKTFDNYNDGIILAHKSFKRLKLSDNTINKVTIYFGIAHKNINCYIDNSHIIINASVNAGGVVELPFPTDGLQHFISITFKSAAIGENASAINTNHVILQPNKSTISSYTGYIYGFKIEKGNKPTDWSPNPDLTQAELDLKASNESLENERNKLQEALNKANQRIDSINAVIQSLTSSGANESVLTQTPEGWKFNMTKFNSAINANQEAIAKETTERQTGDSNNAALINKVNGYVTKIENGQEISYVNIGTDADNNPCVLLGKNGGTDNQFRVSISNKEIQFLKDSGNGNYTKIAYIDGSTFYGDNITAVKRLQVGISPNNYYWEVRSNGNLGLNYKTN